MFEPRDGADEDIDALEGLDTADVQQHAFIFGDADKFLGLVSRDGIEAGSVHAGRDDRDLLLGGVVEILKLVHLVRGGCHDLVRQADDLTLAIHANDAFHFFGRLGDLVFKQSQRVEHVDDGRMPVFGQLAGRQAGKPVNASGSGRNGCLWQPKKSLMPRMNCGIYWVSSIFGRGLSGPAGMCTTRLPQPRSCSTCGTCSSCERVKTSACTPNLPR